MKRKAYIIRSNATKSRHVCIDVNHEHEIMSFLQADPARKKKFDQIVRIIVENLRNTELYDKEDINKKAKDVTAMKMFKTGQNIRIYCKEMRNEKGQFYVIMAELLEKKKTQKNTGEAKRLIEKVAEYEYEIVERPDNQAITNLKRGY